MVPIVKLSLSDGSEANAAYFTHPDNTPSFLPQLTLSSFIDIMPTWRHRETPPYLKCDCVMQKTYLHSPLQQVMCNVFVALPRWFIIFITNAL